MRFHQPHMQPQHTVINGTRLRHLALLLILCLTGMFGSSIAMHNANAAAAQNACALTGDFEGAELRPFYVQGPGLTLTADAGYNSAKSAKISISKANTPGASNSCTRTSP
jgi:hypothetical protein